MFFSLRLTDIVIKNEIKLINIKPKSKVKAGKYTYIPYKLEIKCSYDKFSKFISDLEKNGRLINIDGFRYAFLGKSDSSLFIGSLTLVVMNLN